MKKIIYYGDNGYYYEGDQLYTEAGVLVPEGDAMVLHFTKYGRTPLSVGTFTQVLKEDEYNTRLEKFFLLMDHLSASDRTNEIKLAIKRLKKQIKFLPQTTLSGGMMNERELFYENKITALEQRLEGNAAKDWSGLHQDLIGKYISEVSPVDFTYVMNGKRTPEGRGPILWTGNKNEAFAFQEHFRFGVPQFNDCFRTKNGVRLHPHNKPGVNLKPEFKAILEKHRNQ